MKPATEELGGILLEAGLPETLEGVPIYADFRNMIRFSLILQDAHLSAAEKTCCGLQQLFGELPPGDTNHAVELLLWFYHGGKTPEDGGEASGQGRRPERAYDFAQDAGHIYAAFLQAYHVDLLEVGFLHWWAFLALLDDLPEDTALAKIIQWRTMDLAKVKDKELRAYYAELKKRFSLEAPLSREVSLEEITRRNLERMDRRFAEAERRRQERAAAAREKALNDAAGAP